MILHDQDDTMQETAAGLLAQISDLNPALIFPKLRKVLQDTTYALANSRVPRLEVHGAKIVISLAVHVS
jgi:hypothetical protein